MQRRLSFEVPKKEPAGDPNLAGDRDNLKRSATGVKLSVPDMSDGTPGQVTLLIHASASGDDAAKKKLVGDLYGDLRRIAGQMMRAERPGHTLPATALVNEFVLQMMSEEKSFSAENRHHFLCLAARAMRRLLVDHARSKRAAKRGFGVENVPMQPEFEGASMSDEKLLLINDALDRLQDRSERQARVAEMRIFGGFTVAETAQALSVTARTVGRDWQLAKAWLQIQIVGSQSDARAAQQGSA